MNVNNMSHIDTFHTGISSITVKLFAARTNDHKHCYSMQTYVTTNYAFEFTQNAHFSRDANFCGQQPQALNSVRNIQIQTISKQNIEYHAKLIVINENV